MMETAINWRIYILEMLPLWVSNLLIPSWKRKLLAQTRDIQTTLKGYVTSHVAEFDPDNPRDVVDGYIKERGAENLDATAMANNMMAFTSDAIHTMAMSFNLVMWYMAKHPDVQSRVQEQLDQVVGSARKVTMKDRSQLPLVDAVIYETLRMMTPLPVSLPRETHEDVTFRG